MITVNDIAVKLHFKKMHDVLAGDGMKKLARDAQSILEREIGRAFSQHVDPTTSRPWAAKADGTQATLQQTGTLKALVYAQHSMFGGKPRVSAAVRNASKARASKGKSVSYGLVAGALFYGRPGMPARRFAGFGKTARAKLRDTAQRLVRATKSTAS